MITSVAGPNSVHAAWVSEHDFALAGYRPAGPETDYGMRWGKQESIRVSFAPRADSNSGYLYAHDRETGRVQLIVAHTTRAEVDEAWQMLRDLPRFENAHRAFATLIAGEPDLGPEHAHALWERCVQIELEARHGFRTEHDPALREEKAGAVILSERARVSAETIARDSIAHATQSDPIVVRYRFAEWPGWFGRYAAENVRGAADQARALERMAKDSGFTLQVTSASCGHRVVSAPRVPELAFASRPPVDRDPGYPQIGL